MKPTFILLHKLTRITSVTLACAGIASCSGSARRTHTPNSQYYSGSISRNERYQQFHNNPPYHYHYYDTVIHPTVPADRTPTATSVDYWSHVATAKESAAPTYSNTYTPMVATSQPEAKASAADLIWLLFPWGRVFKVLGGTARTTAVVAARSGAVGRTAVNAQRAETAIAVEAEAITASRAASAQAETSMISRAVETESAAGTRAAIEKPVGFAEDFSVGWRETGTIGWRPTGTVGTP